MKETKIVFDPVKDPMLPGDFQKFEEVIKMSHCDFTRTRSGSTVTYTMPDRIVKYIPKLGGLGGRNAQFIGLIKKHFNSIPLPETIPEGRPFYEYFRPISTYTKVSNTCEVDLTAAYYTAALNLGYIDRELYEKAFNENISKKARLIAIGVLGKKTETTKFKYPYEDEIKPVVTYERTRPFWDNIVFEIGELMREVVAMYKPHVWGIWFDAVFCDAATAPSITKYMQRRGFPSHQKKLSSYIIEPRGNMGAKIIRCYKNGDVEDLSEDDKKEMQISYLDKTITFEQFLKKCLE